MSDWLESTPFWKLYEGPENWLIIDDECYLVTPAQNDSEEIMLFGSTCLLDKSESLSFLEQRYLQSQLGTIQDFLTAEQEDLHPNTDWTPYLLRLCGMVSKEMEERKSASAGDGPQKDEDSAVCPQKSLLSDYRPVGLPEKYSPLLLWGEMCLPFKPLSEKKAKKGDAWLHHNGRWYGVKGRCPRAADIETEIKECIIEGLMDACEGVPESPTYTSSDASRIRLGETEGDRVLLEMDLEPFVLRKRGRYFLFPETRASLEILLDDNAIRIPGPAEIRPEYKHPFAYGDGRICYGTDIRFRRQGILFTKAYDPSDTGTLSSTIASLFEEVEKVLHVGYLKGARPVKRLLTERFEHLLISEEEAEASPWSLYRN